MKNEKVKYKKVLKPISVPDNDYCWDGHTSCINFDDESGHPTCGQGFHFKELYLRVPQLKPKECLSLSNAKIWSEEDQDYTP